MTARTFTITHASEPTQLRWPNLCTIKAGMNDRQTSKYELLSILKSAANVGSQSISAKSRKAHFDNIALERIRYFEQEECPRIISTSGCNADNNEIRQYIPKKDTQDWQRISITYTNWTPVFIETHKLVPMVLLEMIVAERSTVEDQEDTEHNNSAREDVTTLKGTVRVRNHSYHKQVSIRYTLNDWQSYSSVAGYYTRSISPLYDEFAFDLDIPLTLSTDHQATISMQVELAVQYCFNGREFWDNNNSRNYKLFVTRHPTIPKKPAVVYPKTIKRPNSATSLFTSSTTTPPQPPPVPEVTKQSPAHDPEPPSDSSNSNIISYPSYNKNNVLRKKHFMQEISLETLCSSKPKHSGIRHISKPCNYSSLMTEVPPAGDSPIDGDQSQTWVKKYCYHGQQLSRHRPSILM
ncbi:putative phosphatase regulatory subunit-domain-containing protein [Umbelopsis sp. PMI_123]|nr:putative phosphatase regulatory subunit-domain-containing protein [Umbelopsis sp. PMI_123]